MVRYQKRPQRISNFNQWILATGGLPLLRTGEPRLLAGRFDIAVTLTDNAVVSADLRLGSVWDLRVQGLYSNSATPLEAVFQAQAARLYINDDVFTEETVALKESLDNLAYIQMVRSGNTINIPLRSHIAEMPFKPAAGLTTAQLALTQDRARLAGAPRRFERPYRIDLKTDQLLFKLDTAINWASGNILGYVQLWGHIAPRDYAGAMVSDGSVCAETEEAIAASAGPADFSEFAQSGFGGSLLGIPASSPQEYAG